MIEWILVRKVRVVLAVTGGGGSVADKGGRGLTFDGDLVVADTGESTAVLLVGIGEKRNSCPAARVRGVIVPFDHQQLIPDSEVTRADTHVCP
jgi:hypothetical protein